MPAATACGHTAGMSAPAPEGQVPGPACDARASSVALRTQVAFASPSSSAQKQFNKLVSRVEAQRASLENWREFLPAFESQLALELRPLQRRVDGLQRDILLQLETALDGALLTRRERDGLVELIVESSLALLDDDDDAVVQALHDRHAPEPYDEAMQRETDRLKAMAVRRLGVRPDDWDGASTPDEVLAAVERHRRSPRQDATAQAEAEAAGAPPAASRDASADTAQRARRQAREEREAAMALRSVRDVFRRLASRLHPDREPDPVERERKTALMQRANQAYEQRDLLQLMALQIESTQFDAGQLARLDDARLRQLVSSLKQLLAELDGQLQALIAPWATSLRSGRDKTPTPQALRMALQSDLSMLRQHASLLRRELDALRDPRVIKAWLPQLKARGGARRDRYAAMEALLDAMDGSPHA